MKTLLTVITLVTLVGSAMGQSTTPPVAGSAQPAGNLTMKNGSTALLYSLLFPGGGQFYNGETTKGLIQLGGTVVGLVLFAAYFPTEEFVENDYYWASYGYWEETGDATVSYGGLAVALGFRLWSIIDAPSGAKRYNARHGLVSCPIGDNGLYVSLDNVSVNHTRNLGLKVGFSF